VEITTAIACDKAKALAKPASEIYPLKPTARRIRFRSRSVDLAKGLSSPLLCAPAHLLGCSACLASPQLLAQLLVDIPLIAKAQSAGPYGLEPRGTRSKQSAIRIKPIVFAPAGERHEGPPPVYIPRVRKKMVFASGKKTLPAASGHHAASPVYPSCMHLPGAGVPTWGTSHWPTGGTHCHCESNAPPGPMRVASGRCDEDSLIYFVSTHVFHIHSHVHLRLVGVMVERARAFHHPTPCSAYSTVSTWWSVLLGHYFPLRLRSRASVR
jgi:hypothetical protein